MLDIGCGVGRLTRALAARCREVIALDVSDEMLARARANLNPELENVRWLLGDGARSLEVGDRVPASTAAISLVVFQHLPDPEIALGYVRELGRVLRPGGWAALQVSNDPAVHRPRDGLRLRAPGAGSAARRAASAIPPGSAPPVDLTQMEGAAAASGLVVERVWGAGTQYCLLLLRRRP